MGLEEYQKKRDFRRTPEPAADGGTSEAPGEGLAFVVQKHRASHLHYDFRLELDGVMLSWAVPKGPSVDPAEKRLAMRTEDHPMEYRHFEGVIPEGEYGGGTVMVWDRGTWEPEDDARKGLDSGTLKFTLHGQRLRGRWQLVRTNFGEDRESWLLMKKKDRFAADESEGRLVERAMTSVVSGRTMNEIAADRDRVWSSTEGEVGVEEDADSTASPSAAAKDPAAASARELPDPSDFEGARKQSLPKLPEPMLAKLAEHAPDGEDWLHEMKFDGYRILARLDRGEVRLITRGGNDWTAKYPEVEEELRGWPPVRAVLDGELVVLLADGTTSFQALQQLEDGALTGVLVYYVFDLLHLDGYDLRPVPLRQRKEVLRDVMIQGERVRYSEHVEGRGAEFFRQACTAGLEGIISKRAHSRYSATRSSSWRKVKCVRRQEFVVVGYSEPSGSREGFGSLLLGVHDDEGRLTYAGRVGTGFTDRVLGRLAARLADLEISESPLNDGGPSRSRTAVHWVEPSLVAEVAFTEWTDEGILRHPSFQGLREDRDPRDVIREDTDPARVAGGDRDSGPAVPQKTERSMPMATARKSKAEPATVAGVRVTSLERVVYPGPGVTKSDLFDYYSDIAELMLPHLRERPLTLVRCPGGVDEECFYQKHGGEGTPDIVPRVDVKSPDEKAAELYLYVDELPALIALVQLGVLEFHVWNSRVAELERPDQVVFDLDPAEDLDFRRVVEAAREVRDRLREVGLVPFLKTTGGKGLHVVVPIEPTHDWEVINGFAKVFAQGLASAQPERYTANMSKAKRAGRIFVDYLRNARDATQVAAYSTRAREGATVSVPIRWDELRPSLDPGRYTVKTVPRRVRSLKADPWEDFEKSRRELTFDMVEALSR